MDISIVDATLCFDANGEPRVNLGDLTTGVGIAASAPMFGAGDGFIGIPNGPDGSNQAPQALMGTLGLYRIALAIRDPRYVGKAGQLGEGDRAIVSNCDASLLLSKASNKILLQTRNMSAVLDASGDTLTLTWTDGAGTTSTVTLGPSAALPLKLEATGPGGSAEFIVTPVGGGQVTITAPGGLFLNGHTFVLSGGVWTGV